MLDTTASVSENMSEQITENTSVSARRGVVSARTQGYPPRIGCDTEVRPPDELDDFVLLAEQISLFYGRNDIRGQITVVHNKTGKS